MEDLVARIVALALEEDLGPSGDLTAALCIESTRQGEARFLAKADFVLAGAEVAAQVFRAVDAHVEVIWSRVDGDSLARGEVFGTVRGSARSLLSGERVALNFLQRLSGIATVTAKAVAALGSSRTRLIDTRKTTPGLRVLEKAAVRAGGGHNHRMGLFDGVLIKDNHIAAAGSITRAVEAAKRGVHALLKVECEVVDLPGVDEALRAGADMLLLDNMSDAMLAEAVKRVAGRVPVEASGNMTLDRLPRVASAGADYVSMGAITHSAPAVDISLEMELHRA